jgi:hypothetical protein
MTKIANAYYSAVVAHKEVDGLYHATYGIPGHSPEWVLGRNGQPETFRDHDQAMLAGFRLMVAKLNRARHEQDFRVKGHQHGNKTTRVWIAPTDSREPTVDQVFGKKQ